MPPHNWNLLWAVNLPSTVGKQKQEDAETTCFSRTHQFFGKILIRVQGSPQLSQAVHEVLKPWLLPQLIEQGRVAMYSIMETSHTIHIHVILPSRDRSQVYKYFQLIYILNEINAWKNNGWGSINAIPHHPLLQKMHKNATEQDPHCNFCLPIPPPTFLRNSSTLMASLALAFLCIAVNSTGSQPGWKPFKGWVSVCM